MGVAHLGLMPEEILAGIEAVLPDIKLTAVTLLVDAVQRVKSGWERDAPPPSPRAGPHRWRSSGTRPPAGSG
jgi:hypothetical protein